MEPDEESFEDIRFWFWARETFVKIFFWSRYEIAINKRVNIHLHKIFDRTRRMCVLFRFKQLNEFGFYFYWIGFWILNENVKNK